MEHETNTQTDIQQNSKAANRKWVVLKRFRRSKRIYKDWLDAADEDYDFGLGKQWADEDKQNLATQKRPCLTFNRLRPLIDVVAGYQRENEARLKVRPEGGEDKLFSDIIDRVIMHINKTSKLDYKLGYVNDDGTICGKGYIEAYLNYDDDPIRGQLEFRQIPYYQFLPDPDCTEYDLNKGAEFGHKVVKYSRRKLKQMFPEKAAVIDAITPRNEEYYEALEEGGDDDYGNDPNSATVVREYNDPEGGEKPVNDDEELLLIEEWYKKYVSRFFTVDKSDDENDYKTFETKKEAEAFVQGQGGGKIFERKVAQMWVTSCIEDVLIRDEISPLEPFYNGFPFFRYMAKWSPSCKNELLKVQGIIRNLKDPQREKNKSHSQMLHILNTQANTGWIGDTNALTEAGWRDLAQLGSVPNVIIKKRRGSELREIQQKGVPAGQLQREVMADDEFNKSSGINPDLMGIQDKTASGRAISLRIKQAVTILVPMFQNYRYTKEILGRFVLKMIPNLFDKDAGGLTKLKKILGRKYLTENFKDENPDGMLAGYLTMIKDDKYDVEVTESDRSKTMRSEIFDQLIELAKTPAGAFLPGEMFVEYMDISNGEEIKKAIRDQRQMMSAGTAQK